MKAVIMAGGEGTRLRPLTCEMPKPNAPIAGHPCIYYIADLLLRHGINDICASALYRAEDIKATLSSLKETNIRVFTEEKDIGTAGSVKMCEKFLNDTFIVISGDCICDFDLTAATEFHRSHGGIATILLSHSHEPLEYGVAVLDETNRITRFIEKPSWSRAYSDTVNTGIYIFSREIFDYIPADTNCDFSKDIFPSLMEKGQALYGYIADGYWCDIGNIKTFLQCNFDVLSGELCGDFMLDELKSPYTFIPDGVSIREPVYIGKNVKFTSGTIGPYAIIGDGCELGKDVYISSSVLCDNVTVDDGVYLRGSVICPGARMGKGSSAGEYAVVGANSSVGKKSIVSAGTKVYPKNIIPERSFVKTNIINGIKGFFFEENAITAHWDENVDIPSFVRLGAAIGTSLSPSVAVAVIQNRSSEDLSAPLYALISGILSSSSDVFDLGKCNLTTFSYTIRNFGFGGGVCLYTCGDKICVSVYLSDGLYMNRAVERKIEQDFISDAAVSRSYGRLRHLYGYEKQYASHISSFFEKPCMISAIVTAPAFISSFTALGKDNKAPEYIRITNDALFVQNENKEAFSEDLVNCAVAFCLGKLTGRCDIPYHWPSVLESVAEKEGFDLHRITLEDNDRVALADITDVNMQAAILIKYMNDTGLSFSEIVSRIPPFSARHREIESSADKAEIMRRLSNGKDRELVDGVRIRDKRGNVLIIPRKKENIFSLIAEATDAETASEICDFYAKKIKNRS